MVRGNERILREAEAKEAKLERKRAELQLETVKAGVEVALEKIRILSDKRPRRDRKAFLSVIADLKRARNSLVRAVDDLKGEVRPETDDEYRSSDIQSDDEHESHSSDIEVIERVAAPVGNAPAGNLLVKRESEDGAAGN